MKKKVHILTVILFTVLLFVFPAYAGSLEGTQAVVGTKNLLRDLTAVLTGMILVITIALEVKNVGVWQAASPEEKPKCKKVFTDTLLLGILGTTISGIITAVLSYYGG